jgi:hypothetical protein
LNSKGKLDWNKLANREYPELINKVSEIHPYERKFDWWKEKKYYHLEDKEKFE